jgi:hypothetical protein
MGNPTIFRTTNPVDFSQVDGVYIDERKPPGPIRGIGNDVVCVVGEFERGPVNVITSIGSSQELFQQFGGFGPDASGNGYKGYIALLNKQFGRLRVIRVSNSMQVTAVKNIIDAMAENVLEVKADSPGLWGNSLSVSVEAASDGDAAKFNLVVKRNGLVVETHRNLAHATTTIGAFYAITSSYITAKKLAADRPANIADQALTTGADGTFADADYTGGPSDARGLELLKGTGASDIRWVFVAENNSATIKASLLSLVTGEKTKIAVIAGAAGDTPTQAATDVASYRSDRVVYVYPYVDTFVPDLNSGKGALMRVAPTSFAAAAMAALPPGRDPAGVNSEDFLTGVKALAQPNLTRNDYVTFNEKGIMALQFAAERQRYSFRSGRTASLDTALQMVGRRTMADYLQESIAAALVFFQNAPLNEQTKLSIKGACEDFLERQVLLGLLPSREDLDFGTGEQLLPFEVDISSLNTPAQEATGLFIVSIKVRIFASARFIVLRTEIGEAVEITEEQQAA